MALRLLSKDEITKARNIDRSREIGEGKKLSQRVDDLRQLAAQEEQGLEKFRVSTLENIHKEIRTLNEQKDSLLAEVSSIRAELAKESVLSRKERQNLEALKLDLERRSKELEEQSFALNLRELDIAETIKNAQDSFARALSHETIAKKLNAEAETKDKEVSQRLATAKKVEQTARQHEEEVEVALTLRENAIVTRESSVKELERQNIERARDLEQKERQLNDQRKTLERAMERLKKTRLA